MDDIDALSDADLTFIRQLMPMGADTEGPADAEEGEGDMLSGEEAEFAEDDNSLDGGESEENTRTEL